MVPKILQLPNIAENVQAGIIAHASSSGRDFQYGNARPRMVAQRMARCSPAKNDVLSMFKHEIVFFAPMNDLMAEIEVGQ